MNRKNHIGNKNSGYVLVLAVVFLGIFFVTSSAYISFVTSSARSARYDIENTQAVALAEAGIDNAIYQLNQDGNYSGEINTAVGNGVYTVSISNVNLNLKRITSTGFVPDAINPRITKTVTVLANVNTTIVSFHYGVQVGSGGLNMNNNSIINGNLYSDGNITGNGTITGDAISSGINGLIDGITVNGTARAHSISNCSIGMDAYYQHISNCSVAGEEYSESDDQPSEAMPISEEQIDEWENFASTGNTISGNYALNGIQTLGPTVIDGDLTVNGTLKLGGIVWVKGNVVFANNSHLTVSSSTGDGGAILIADVPGNESTKGTVVLSNNMEISGNGSDGSFPMILSTNSGSSAIALNNNADSVILYASNGTVLVSNNASANQITAQKVSLSNNATIDYVSGLQNQSFSNGQGGSWAIIPGSYSISR